MQDGVKVYGVGRNIDKLEQLKQYGDFIPVVADFKEYDRLHQIITERDFDVFYHFAREGGYFAESFKDFSLQIRNIEYDCKAIECLVKIRAKRFVYAQTGKYFEILEFIKNDVVRPRWVNVYAASKMASEIIGKTIVFNNHIEYVSGAPCVVYGPGGQSTGSFLYTLIEKIIRGSR